MYEEQMRLEKLRYQLASWAYRIWHQGFLVLKIHSANLNQEKGGTILDRSGEFMGELGYSIEAYGALNRAHEHYFLNALGKFFRWHEVLSRVDGVDVPSDLPLMRHRAEYYDARNMWEHDEEYLLGKGRDRSRYVWDRTWRNNDGRPIRVESSWSMTLGDEYVLANRVEVFPVTLAAKDTAIQLSKRKFGPDFIKQEGVPPVHLREWFGSQWPPDCAVDALERF